LEKQRQSEKTVTEDAEHYEFGWTLLECLEFTSCI